MGVLNEKRCKNIITTDFEGVGKYKKAILKHSGFDIDVNINLGFYTKM